MRYRIKDEAWLEFLKQNSKDLSDIKIELEKENV